MPIMLLSLAWFASPVGPGIVQPAGSGSSVDGECTNEYENERSEGVCNVAIDGDQFTDLESIPCFAAAPQLRVVTYNIHHGRGTDGVFDYDRLAQVISSLNPDIVALQEVDNGTRRASGVDQASELARRLKMNHAFGNALYFSGGEYGEAILSRFPIERPQAHHLPYRYGNEPRTALAVHVKPDNGLPEFVFVGTHLCHQSGETRLEQAKELNQLFTDAVKLPVILVGDLNARPNSPPMKALFEEGWVDSVAPKSVIDFILFRESDPWEVVETRIPDQPVASDHDPVLAVLNWAGE